MCAARHPFVTWQPSPFAALGVAHGAAGIGHAQDAGIPEQSSKRQTESLGKKFDDLEGTEIVLDGKGAHTPNEDTSMTYIYIYVQ